MSLKNWKEFGDVERALLRMYDPESEIVFRGVKNGLCPNLSFVGKLAVCSIYSTRPEFCREFPKAEVTIPECIMTKPEKKVMK